jgi:antitoxin ParD1/3/4
MDDLTVSISGSEREYIDAQVASGKYDTPAEAVCDLIRQAQLRAARGELDAMIREGIESGEPVRYTREWLEERKQASMAKARERST